MRVIGFIAVICRHPQDMRNRQISRIRTFRAACRPGNRNRRAVFVISVGSSARTDLQRRRRHCYRRHVKRYRSEVFIRKRRAESAVCIRTVNFIGSNAVRHRMYIRITIFRNAPVSAVAVGSLRLSGCSRCRIINIGNNSGLRVRIGKIKRETRAVSIGRPHGLCRSVAHFLFQHEINRSVIIDNCLLAGTLHRRLLVFNIDIGYPFRVKTLSVRCCKADGKAVRRNRIIALGTHVLRQQCFAHLRRQANVKRM